MYVTLHPALQAVAKAGSSRHTPILLGVGDIVSPSDCHVSMLLMVVSLSAETLGQSHIDSTLLVGHVKI